jgi:Zn-dependent protease
MSKKFSIPKIKRNTAQLLLTLGTTAGLAAVNYTIIHNPIVFVFVMSLFIHEFGHYFVARKHGANPDLPYFIPLFPFNIGVTRIRNLMPKDIPAVSIAGPMFASIFLMLFIMFNSLYRIFSFMPLFIMLALEIIFNYFGSDGKKYRKYNSSFI